MNWFDICDIIYKFIWCAFYIIIGERSCGKSYSVKKEMIRRASKGKPSAYVRRTRTDVEPRKLDLVWTSLIEDGSLYEIVSKDYPGYDSYSVTRYLGNFWVTGRSGKNEERLFLLAYVASLTEWESYKGSDYLPIHIFLYDEFLTRGKYLKDETICLLNLISTFVRYREETHIILLGNTVSKINPYNKLFNIDIGSLELGETKIWDYTNAEGESQKVLVHRCKNYGNSSAKYFGFDDPKISMIRKGTWEHDLYPSISFDYRPTKANTCLEIHMIDDCVDLWTYLVCKDGNVYGCVYHKRMESISYPTYLTLTGSEYVGGYPNTYYQFKIVDSPEIMRIVRNVFAGRKLFFEDIDAGEQCRYILKNWN